MIKNDEKVIAQRRERILKLAFGSSILLIIGIIFLFISPEFFIEYTSKRYHSPFLVSLLGWSSLILGCLILLISLIKSFDKSPGFTLNQHGFTDNSNLLSCGFIPWSEVKEISIQDFRNQKNISVTIKNPEKYANQGNIFKRLAKRANYKLSGTPVHISPNYLKIDPDRLVSILNEYMENYK